MHKNSLSLEINPTFKKNLKINENQMMFDKTSAHQPLIQKNLHYSYLTDAQMVECCL